MLCILNLLFGLFKAKNVTLRCFLLLPLSQPVLAAPSIRSYDDLLNPSPVLIHQQALYAWDVLPETPGRGYPPTRTASRVGDDGISVMMPLVEYVSFNAFVACFF